MCPGRWLSDPGYFYWLLMYVERAAKDVIAKMQPISHLHLRYFINSNVLNVGSLIYLYNDLVIPRIVWVGRYGMNILFILLWYFIS